MTEEQFTSARRTLTAQLIAALSALWASLGSWRTADVDGFLEQAVPTLRASQLVMAEVTAQFIAEQASETLRRPVAPPSLPEDKVTDLRRGVSDRELLTRPFEQTWTGLASGDDLEKAVDRGRARLIGLAEFEMQEAHSHAARETMQQMPKQDKPRWWRRVPQGPVTCALCLLASTRVYRIADLNPIHPACDCTVKPEYGKPPTVVADADLLERVQEAVAKELGREGVTDAATLRELAIQATEEHGELGPVLRRPGADKADSARIAQASTPQSKAKAELRILEPTLARLENRAADGEDVSGPLNWQRERVARLRRIAAGN